MNVEIGAEAALFPEKEYINRIAVAVCIEVILSFDPGRPSPKSKVNVGILCPRQCEVHPIQAFDFACGLSEKKFMKIKTFLTTF